MVQAVRLAREIAETKALRRFGLVRELKPGVAVRSDLEIARYVKSAIETGYHPAGTCAMGTSPTCVVDPSLRVYGIDGLRIADASIMPSLVNGNTNGPTIMIAEKAADHIRGLAAETTISAGNRREEAAI
jgi:choline dehydrogenase